MQGRSHARRDHEPSASGSMGGEVDSTRSESAGGNDVAARGTRASDAQSGARQPSSIAGTLLGSSGPTSMRSRVTVVCAECKKQKLRCDRRIPCESCVKRNTVSRCIYTPAAIEKVDVTSINNRLRVVEGSLNALGVSAPVYSSHVAALQVQANPQAYMQHQQYSLGTFTGNGGTGLSLSAAPTVPFTVSASTQYNSHPPKECNESGLTIRTPQVLALTNDGRCASAVAPLDGVSALWVREMIAETGQRDPRGSTISPHSATGNMVSSQVLNLDPQPIDRESTGAVPAFGFEAEQAIDVKQRLSLHAGLGISSSLFCGEGRDRLSENEVRRSSTNDEGVMDSITDVYTPLAAQLLTQFPSQHVRREMLARLGAANLTGGTNLIPFGAFCESIESLCSSVAGKDPERMRGSSQPVTPSFSAIAEAAAGLAVGAMIWAIEPRAVARTSNSPTEGVTSLGNQSSSSPPEAHFESGYDEGEVERPDATTAFALYRLANLALAMHTARHGHAARDIALIHTHILSAHYLLLAQSTTADCATAILPPELPPLVGTLVWEARAMGLGIDPDEFDSPSDTCSSYETQHADGVPCHGVEISVKREDACERAESRFKKKGMSLYIKEVRRRLWWSVVWFDLLVSDAYGYSATIRPGEYSTRLPANVDDSCFHPGSVTLPPPDDSSPERNITFYIVKLRLLEIGKHAPARAFRSGMVQTMEDRDSATAVAAQRLADEVVQWLDDLPERFKLDANEEDPPPVASSQPSIAPFSPTSGSKQKAAKLMLITQRCDLAFHAYHTLVRVFTPRLFRPALPVSSRETAFSWPGDQAVSADRQFAGLRAIEPALAVVNAAQMQMTYAGDAPRGACYMYIFPRRLFDAAVVLAYLAIQQPLYTSPVVIEAVRTALDILSHVLRRHAPQDDTNTSQKTEAEHIIETLLKRAEQARFRSTPIMAGIKRKHDELEHETDHFDGPFRFPFLSSGIVNAYVPPSQTNTSRRDGAGSETVFTSPQRSASVYARSRSVILLDNTRSRRPAKTAPVQQQSTVPAVSIRQRLRDRRSDASALDTSESKSNPSDSNFSAPSSYSASFQPPPSLQQQLFHAGPSASPAPSVFRGELTTASPISPLPQYDTNDGGRAVYGPTGHPFRGTNFIISDAHSAAAIPIPRQEHPTPSSTMYHYSEPGVPSLTFPFPPTLQHHHARESSMARDPTTSSSSGTEYGMSPIHAVATDRLDNWQEEIDGARPWPSTNFGEQPLNAHSPYVPGIYPPEQHLHSLQNQSRPWSTSGNATPDSLTPTWNGPSGVSWNHGVQ